MYTVSVPRDTITAISNNPYYVVNIVAAPRQASATYTFVQSLGLKNQKI